MSLKTLQEKRARLATQMRAMVDAAKKEDRGFSTEDRTAWDRMTDEVAGVDALIEAENKVVSIETSLGKIDETDIIPAFADAGIDAGTGGRRGKKIDNSPHAKAFGKYLRDGMGGLDADERKLMQSNLRGNIQNAQTITTTGGGYLIPQGFSDQLEEAMKWFGGIIGEVDVFDTETGNPLPWPTENDTANKGRMLAINTQLTETDLTFGQVTFNAYIATSDSILVPLALIQDSYFDLNAHIARVLGTRLGRLMNYQGTVGTGSSAPTGISTAVTTAGNTVQGATGETTSCVYNDLVNLLHLVDPAYRQRPDCKFMFVDSTLKVLRKLVDGNNRPLWQPGINAGFGGGFPETILDKPYVINQDMPVMAANAYSIIFGALKAFKFRRAGGVTMLRLVERYADYLQVGFLGFTRFDSNLIDAGTHPVAAFQNSAT
jgi:HK97 family phage major capsid protein